MYDREKLNPALQELETALGRLQPAKTGLDRDQLMFNAGRASARSSRPWQAASGLLMVTLLYSLFMREPITEIVGHPVREPVVPVARQRGAEPAAHDHASVERMSYLRLRRQILQEGLDALPPDGGGRRGKVNSMNREQWLGHVL